jgi:hypothetical protein
MKIQRWTLSDIGVELSNLCPITDLFIPELGQIECCFIQGDTPEERGRNLARKLNKAGIIL